MRHDLDNKKIAELYQSKMRIMKIVKELGCDRTTLYSKLKKLKIPLRQSNSPVKWERVKSLYESGLSLSQIKKIMGYSSQNVDAILRKLNVKRKGVEPQKNKLCPVCNELKFNREFSEGSKRCRICAKNYVKPKKEKISDQDYFLILKPEHPRSNKNGYVKEHILVWENFYNKTLPNNYVIHHINGDKKDNRVNNLLALTLSKHHSLISPYKKRIKELEAEISRLRQQTLI